MRHTLWGIALLLLGCLVGVLVGQFLTKFPLPQRLATARNRLDVKIERVDFQNVPLGQVVEKLNHECGCNIGVNWRTLHSMGVDENTPILVQTQNLPLKKVLELICADAGTGTGKIGYRGDDGIIFISTAEDLAKETVVRVYDVRGLITDDHDLRERMHRLIDPRKWEELTDARSKEPGHFRDDANDSIKSLMTAIVQTIDPDSWRDAGGTTGSIREFGGRLIVIQTPETQTQIAALLDRLEKGT